MTDDVPASQRWRGRPVHSLLLQVFVFAIPVVASVTAATAVSSVGPRPDTPLEFVAWWVVLTAVALAVLALVDRAARKLLPLATLLKLSMVFPDRAPSRFRVARNAASVRTLQEQLAEARERGLTAEPMLAAETVLTLITALGHHDRRSRGHSERVHVYAELLAEELDLPQYDRDRLRWAALLHDVGKLVIPTELLNKPAAPDDEEWHALRRHPKEGAELCAPLLEWLGEWGLAIEQHHEWFDGSGYPAGLSGLEISRAARIVAVADCYEVMTTSRTYKRALNPAAARQELARCAGTQFDPAIVRAFLNVSLGRLRMAMGPLALLSTVPSMARLSSLLEPLARAGAVMGGAAVLVGGGAVLDSGVTAAEPATAAVDVVHADVAGPAPAADALNSVAVAERRLALDAADGFWSGSNPPRPAEVALAQARSAPAESRSARRPTAARTGDPNADRETADGRRRTKTRRGSPDRDRPTKAATAPEKATTPPRVRAPRPAGGSGAGGGGGSGGGTAAGDGRGDEDLGANPTPPTSPPGQAEEKPDGPPPDPTPPRNRRAHRR